MTSASINARFVDEEHVPTVNTLGYSHEADDMSTSAWNEIDRQLAEWLADPENLVDFDALAPSRDIIRLARTLIPMLRQDGPAPSMVLPNGDGGIAFEFHTGPVYRNLELLKDGRKQLTVFRGNQLHARRYLE